MDQVDIKEVLKEARRYERARGMAVARHPCRDKIREALFNGNSIYSIFNKCEDKVAETGNTAYRITKDALTSYKKDPVTHESIVVEYQEKRREAKRKAKAREERNPGIDLCMNIIKIANDTLNEAEKTNFVDMNEAKWKLIDRGVAASKALPVIKKAEPEIFDYEEVALLDPTGERITKEVADYIAKHLGTAKGAKAKP